MRRLRAWGAALALLAAADAPPASADEPMAKEAVVRSDGASSTSWYRRLFGGPDKPRQLPKDSARPQPKEAASKTLQEERAICLQRLAVCTRLREIAVETSNDALLKQADELEKQAFDLYCKKVAHLPGSRLTATDSATSIDPRLSPGVAARPLRSAIKEAKGASPAHNVDNPDGDRPRGDQAAAKREE